MGPSLAMAASINTFRNVRARLTRGSDGRCLAGWVTHLAREEARIRLWNFVAMATDERVVCECYGQGTLARFGGRIVAQAGQDLAINLVGSISYAPSEETPRIYATGLVGQLESADGSATMTVLDLSPLSLGALVDSPFDPKERLTMSLPTEMGSITAEVSIANCRADPESPGFFRIGLHLHEMARLDRARWGRLVLERAEA